MDYESQHYYPHAVPHDGSKPPLLSGLTAVDIAVQHDKGTYETLARQPGTLFTRLGQRCAEGTNDAVGKVFPMVAGTFADILGCRLNAVEELRRVFSQRD